MVVSQLDATFAALADPTRREILHRLAEGSATVNELAQPFRMTQQAISKHLAYLERARLIHKKRRGREQLCSLRPERIREVSDWAAAYQRFWTESFGRLDAALVEIAKLEEPHGRKS
ncbi:MAG TPA: metalloregulator ArsR/SmtB family transcription factor [Gammaproteobacteria bacterium]|nr:metalloregulator ArsR/SmtB family transcription factor [Gammaproteobacteria bacterium]